MSINSLLTNQPVLNALNNLIGGGGSSINELKPIAADTGFELSSFIPEGFVTVVDNSTYNRIGFVNLQLTITFPDLPESDQIVTIGTIANFRPNIPFIIPTMATSDPNETPGQLLTAVFSNGDVILYFDGEARTNAVIYLNFLYLGYQGFS